MKTTKKRIPVMILVLVLLALPVPAQIETDTTYIFRFVPQEDVFYVPFDKNAEELRRLFECVEQYRKQITSGETQLYVDGYCNSGQTTEENLSLAKVRSNRVKSELIIHGMLTENCFITHNHTGKGDFVTVRIVVPKADIKPVAQEQSKETVVPPVKEEKEEAVRQKEPQVIEETAQEPRPMQTEEALSIIKDKDEETYTLALRTNLLRWVTLTPDLGIEWRINEDLGIQVNGSWTSWSWDDSNRRYALWEISPEMRYYIGKEKRGYLGAMYKAGAFNYKLSATGRQGDLMGGGITGGYQLHLNNALLLDFNFAIGCLHADYEKYGVIDGVRVRQSKENKNWWGPINAGITLVWQFGK